ncbi:2,3-butanediol dehydrogenase [Patulibacter sp. NPDC049589]|uniref:2,3-butanediol dehydrogenase n=1 Tax=Patulibacter sp. NPDC049589 TaxID=3154731 RepID=UPI0034264BD4
MDFRLEEVPEPAPGPGEVKVAVRACGVCGSDLHEYTMGPLQIPRPESPHPRTGVALPVTLGHEMSGVVAELGAGVEGFAVGDRVAMEPVTSCGRCRPCRRGDYNLCDSVAFMGLSALGGGYADFQVSPANLVHKLPDSVPFDVGALVEPLSVGWYGLQRAGFAIGQTALVTGAGPVGSGVVSCLRTAGAGWVGATDLAPARLALATALGADDAFDPRSTDVVAAIAERTDGEGVDLAIDATGAQAGIDTALACVRRGGTVLSLGVFEEPSTIDLTTMLGKGTRLVQSPAYAWTFPEVIAALARGDLATDGMITARVPLADAVDGAFEELVRNRDAHVKIVIEP